MTDQLPGGPRGGRHRRPGPVRVRRRRFLRTGTILSVITLGAGGGIAAAAGIGDLFTPVTAPTSQATGGDPPTRYLPDGQAADVTSAGGGEAGSAAGQLGALSGSIGADGLSALRRAVGSGFLTGTVTGPSGNALPGVGVYEVTGKAVKLLGTTSKDGSFSVSCPAGPVLLSSTDLAGAPGAARVAAGRYAFAFLGGDSTLSRATAPRCGATHPYAARLDPASQVDGVLTDPADRPLPGVAVRLENVKDPQGLVLGTVTDAAGRYLFSGLPAGHYRLLTGSGPLGQVIDLAEGARLAHTVPVPANLLDSLSEGADMGSVGNGGDVVGGLLNPITSGSGVPVPGDSVADTASGLTH